MQRRDFLRLMGLTAAATAVAPSSIVRAASDKPILRTTYPLHHRPGSWMTGYILDAPAGKDCRAEIVLRSEATKNTVANITGVLCRNDPAQVIVEQVSVRSLNTLSGEIDAAVFNTFEIFVPVDWSAVKRGEPLHIDYRSFHPDEDQTLWLALFYEVRDLDEYRPPGHGSPIYGVRPWPDRAHE